MTDLRLLWRWCILIGRCAPTVIVIRDAEFDRLFVLTRRRLTELRYGA